MSFLNHRAAIDSLNESIAALRRWRVLRWTKAAAKPCPARGPPIDGRAASRSAIVLHGRDRLNGPAGKEVRAKLSLQLGLSIPRENLPVSYGVLYSLWGGKGGSLRVQI